MGKIGIFFSTVRIFASTSEHDSSKNHVNINGHNEKNLLTKSILLTRLVQIFDFRPYLKSAISAYLTIMMARIVRDGAK